MSSSEFEEDGVHTVSEVLAMNKPLKDILAFDSMLFKVESKRLDVLRYEVIVSEDH